jgi:spore germination protein GerM
MRRRLLALLALLVLVAALAGCGIRADEHATFESEDAVPFDLLDTTTSSATPAPARPDTVAVRVCLIDPTDHVVAVTRNLPAAFTLGDLVDAVGQGPTQPERDAGWTTAFSGSDLVDAVGRAAGVAQVGLTDQFTTMPAPDQLKAIAQLVCTFTEQRGVGQVQFTVNGSSAEVPRGDGSATADAVSQLDYADLIDDRAT